MKELRFEEKGVWVKLDIEKRRVKYDSNRQPKEWPETVSKFCAKHLVDHSKQNKDKFNDNEKLSVFFEAKSYVYKKRPYFELFRKEMSWPFPYKDDEIAYIKETLLEAEKFYNQNFVIEDARFNNIADKGKEARFTVDDLKQVISEGLHFESKSSSAINILSEDNKTQLSLLTRDNTLLSEKLLAAVN